MSSTLRQLASNSVVLLFMMLNACEFKHTAGNHGHAVVFLNVFVNEHHTLDRFYPTPFLFWTLSIKCITQLSKSNLSTSTSTHSLSCSA